MRGSCGVWEGDKEQKGESPLAAQPHRRARVSSTLSSLAKRLRRAGSHGTERLETQRHLRLAQRQRRTTDKRTRITRATANATRRATTRRTHRPAVDPARKLCVRHRLLQRMEREDTHAKNSKRVHRLPQSGPRYAINKQKPTLITHLSSPLPRPDPDLTLNLKPTLTKSQVRTSTSLSSTMNGALRLISQPCATRWVI